MSAPLHKPSRKQRPALAKAWDDYGHSIAWEDLIDIKVGGHGYVALAWMEGDGFVNYADLAWNGSEWEMQNDGHEFLTLKQWRSARVASQCDWLEFPRANGNVWTHSPEEEAET